MTNAAGEIRKRSGRGNGAGCFPAEPQSARRKRPLNTQLATCNTQRFPPPGWHFRKEMLDLPNMKENAENKTEDAADADFTLATCKLRTDYRVAALPPDGATRRRLHCLGLSEGRVVRKISGQFFKGPVVVRVNGTDLALGHAMAGHIRVAPV